MDRRQGVRRRQLRLRRHQIRRAGRRRRPGAADTAAALVQRARRRTGPERHSRFVQDDTRGSALRSEEHTSELQSQSNLVCRLLLEKKKKKNNKLIRYRLKL